MDDPVGETNQVAEGTVQADTPQQEGTVVPETSQVTEEAPKQDVAEQDPETKRAFYEMRKQLEDRDKVIEELTRRREPEVDLLGLARGTAAQPFTPQIQNGPQIDYDLTDPVTASFVNKVSDAQREASQAKLEAQRASAQLEDYEAWSKFPNLNPKSSEHDSTFREAVQEAYIAEKLKSVAAGKTPPRLVDVADKVQQRLENYSNQARQQAANEASTTQAKKAAASIETQGTSTPLVEPGVGPEAMKEHLDQLRAKVRQGDTKALIELNKLEDPYLSKLE